MEIVIALIGVVSALAGSWLANYLGRKTANRSEFRAFLTDAYAQVTANYLLFIDGKITRSAIVSSIERALMLCPKHIKPSLSALEDAIIDTSDLNVSKLQQLGELYADYDSLVRKHINKMWRPSDRL